MNNNEWNEYDLLSINRWWDETGWFLSCSNCGLSTALDEPCLCASARDAPEFGFEFFNETLGG